MNFSLIFSFYRIYFRIIYYTSIDISLFVCRNKMLLWIGLFDTSFIHVFLYAILYVVKMIHGLDMWMCVRFILILSILARERDALVINNIVNLCERESAKRRERGEKIRTISAFLTKQILFPQLVSNSANHLTS